MSIVKNFGGKQLKFFQIDLHCNLKSVVWQYFGFLQVKAGERWTTVDKCHNYCNLCLSSLDQDLHLAKCYSQITKFAASVSTGNHRSHLRSKHNISGNVRVHTVEKFFRATPNNRGNASVSSMNKKQLARDIAIWFARDVLPFSKVECGGFADFALKYDLVAAAEDLPSADTIATAALYDVYESLFLGIKKLIKQECGRFAALTVDGWSDNYRRRSYQGHKLHYLTVDFELRNITLRTSCFGGDRKTGENVRRQMRETLKLFDIGGKVFFGVRDEGGNVKKGFRLEKISSRGCIAHGMHNLLMRDGLVSVPEIADVLAKAKRIVGALVYRGDELCRLAEHQKQTCNLLEVLGDVNLDVESDEQYPLADVDGPEVDQCNFGMSDRFITLKQDCPTRWNTSLRLLTSLAANRDSVRVMLANTGNLDICLDDVEWDLVFQMIPFLQKCADAVDIMEGELYPTLNMAMPFRAELLSFLQDNVDDHVSLVLLKSSLRASFDKRFPVDDVVITAALLDPRTRNVDGIESYLRCNNPARDVTKFLKEMVERYITDEDLAKDQTAEVVVVQSSTDGPRAPKLSKFAQLAMKHSAVTEEAASLRREIDAFMLTTASDVENLGGILPFWNAKKLQYPRLAALARAVLAIPATSAPIERVFSVAGQIITARRSLLSPIKLDKLVFIHDNYELIKENC